MAPRWPFVVVLAAVSAGAACADLNGLMGGGEPDASSTGSDAMGAADGVASDQGSFADTTVPTNGGPDGGLDGPRDGPSNPLTDGGPTDAASETHGDSSAPTDGSSDAKEEALPACEDASTPILPAQNNATAVGPVTSASVHLGQPSIAHDLLVVEVDFDQPNASILSLTDTAGNQFKTALGPYYSSDGAGYYIFYAEDIAGPPAPDTVTVTLTSAAQSYIEFYVLEYRGIVTSGAFDVATVGVGSSSAMQSTPALTSSPHELIFGFASAGEAAEGANFAPRNGLDSNMAEDRVVHAPVRTRRRRRT